MNLNLLNNLINSQQNNLMHAVDLAGKDFVYKVFYKLRKSWQVNRLAKIFAVFPSIFKGAIRIKGKTTLISV